MKKLEEFLPFTRPTLGTEEINEVTRCLESGWITTGPRVEQFESALATYLEDPYIITVSSATVGLDLVLRALSFKEGSEVIVSPLTFVSMVNVLLHHKLVPVFVDIERSTYNLNLAQVHQYVSPKTVAIMPVHFAGVPLDIREIHDCYPHLRVIEDCAHAIGARIGEKRVGSFGDIHLFSFHANKNMTCAEGGAVATRDPELADQLKLLRFHGIDRTAWNRFQKSGSQHYDVVCPGYKANLTDMQAALGIHQLTKLEGFNQKRRELAGRYTEAFQHNPLITCPPTGSAQMTHAWHLYAPLIHHNRDAFMEDLKGRNVGTGLHYRPVHQFSYYQQSGFVKNPLPEAEYVGAHILSLPLFPGLTVELQDRVIEIIQESLEKTQYTEDLAA